MGGSQGEADAVVGAEGAGATVREYGSVFLKGLAMGTADAVPGMSGGTIALITGIYERLITAVTALDPRLLAGVRGVGSADGRRRFVADLFDRDVPFLLALGVGMTIGLVAVSQVAHFAIQQFRAATFAFFFGLIAASAVILLSEVDVSTPGRIGVGVAGFAVAFLLAGVSGSGSLPHSLPAVVVSGSIAVSAMVLPGISGASFLILLGQYEFLTGELSDFLHALIEVPAGGDLGAAVDPLGTVVAFVAGALVGLFTVAHAVERALAAYRAATITFLVSLLLGTLRIPVIEVRDNVAAWDAVAVLALLAAAAVGAGAVLALDWYTDELTY